MESYMEKFSEENMEKVYHGVGYVKGMALAEAIKAALAEEFLNMLKGGSGLKGTSGTSEWPSAKGLVGSDFEDYLHEVIGGESKYIKGSTAGREFDGVFGNRWYEAKSGNYWNRLLQDKTIEIKFKQKMAEGLNIAQEYGATYELFSNSPIPDSIKEWLIQKGILFTEILH